MLDGIEVDFIAMDIRLGICVECPSEEDDIELGTLAALLFFTLVVMFWKQMEAGQPAAFGQDTEFALCGKDGDLSRSPRTTFLCFSSSQIFLLCRVLHQSRESCRSLVTRRCG